MGAVTQPTTDVQETVLFLDSEEHRIQFDALAQQWLGISGEEFVRRWYAGEYRHTPDDEEHRPVIVLSMLIPVDLQIP